MITEAETWCLDVESHTDRMIEAAMDQLRDANAAYGLVHDVMLKTMNLMHAPASRRDLDTALGCALREHVSRTELLDGAAGSPLNV